MKSTRQRRRICHRKISTDGSEILHNLTEFLPTVGSGDKKKRKNTCVIVHDEEVDRISHRPEYPGRRHRRLVAQLKANRGHLQVATLKKKDKNINMESCL